MTCLATYSRTLTQIISQEDIVRSYVEGAKIGLWAVAGDKACERISGDELRRLWRCKIQNIGA